MYSHSLGAIAAFNYRQEEVEYNCAYELDNNAIERQMKYIAIGRKNYYFAGSYDGARRAAVLYSLLGTCRLNKVNPWEWLSDVPLRVNVASDDIRRYPG